MLVDSQSDLPVFPHYSCASKHDSHGFLHAFFRMKFKCPKMSRKNGCISCTCETPCPDAKYRRTVHLVMNDNPRLFNDPPRNSKEWKLEYNARTSVERSNKREKLDFKLEDGRHHSLFGSYFSRPFIFPRVLLHR